MPSRSFFLCFTLGTARYFSHRIPEATFLVFIVIQARPLATGCWPYSLLMPSRSFFLCFTLGTARYFSHRIPEATFLVFIVIQARPWCNFNTLTRSITLLIGAIWLRGHQGRRKLSWNCFEELVETYLGRRWDWVAAPELVDCREGTTEQLEVDYSSPAHQTKISYSF